MPRMQDPGKLIPLRPQTPVWWKLVIGCLLLFTQINNRINPAPNLLKASNADQQRGMDAMAVILGVLAIWLIISGVRPIWRKISN